MIEELRAPLRCLRCEYDLRGLERGGNCPECGMAVELSQRRWELETSGAAVPLELTSPVFLRRMGWGCVLVLVAAACTLITRTLNVTAGGASVAVAGTVLQIISMVVLAAGLWLLGTREPRVVHGRKRIGYVIRGGVVLYVALLLGLLWALLVTAPPTFDWFRIYWIFKTGVIALITWAALWRLAEMLKRSSANGKWRTIAQRLAWAWPVAMMVQAIAFPAIYIAPTHMWTIEATPAVGMVTAMVLMPYRLITWPQVTLVDVLWLLLVAMTLVTLIVLIRCAVVLLSAANRHRD